MDKIFLKKQQPTYHTFEESSIVVSNSSRYSAKSSDEFTQSREEKRALLLWTFLFWLYLLEVNKLSDASFIYSGEYDPVSIPTKCWFYL